MSDNQDLHLDPAVYAEAKAKLAYVRELAAAGNQALQAEISGGWVTGAPQKSTVDVFGPGDLTARVAKALAGDNCDTVAGIAAAADLSLDEKMRRIALVDSSTVAWNSGRWAKLLGVSDSRIRQTDTWVRWREAERKSD
jgi:hypothetical protein